MDSSIGTSVSTELVHIKCVQPNGGTQWKPANAEHEDHQDNHYLVSFLLLIIILLPLWVHSGGDVELFANFVCDEGVQDGYQDKRDYDEDNARSNKVTMVGFRILKERAITIIILSNPVNFVSVEVVSFETDRY